MNNWVNIKDNNVFSYWVCSNKCSKGFEVISPNMVEKTEFPLTCPECKTEMKYDKTIVNIETN